MAEFVEVRKMRSQLAASSAEDRRSIVAELTDTHLDEACRLATFILGGDRFEAEDAVQDAAIRAWARANTLRDLEHFRPWFMRIVVNCARDHVRRSRVRPLTDADNLVSEQDIAADVARFDSLDLALRVLTADQRAVIGLKYLNDFTLLQIASVTGERLGTVKSRLHYGLRALRAAVESQEREGA